MSDNRTCRATVTVQLPDGLHLRPLTQISRVAQSFVATVVLRKGEQTADAKRPLDLMTLAAGCGDQLDVEANGDDACAVVKSLVRLFETNFVEDEQ